MIQPEAAWGVMNQLIRSRVAEIASKVSDATGGRVISGPFMGMQIRPEASWGDGDLCPKLLGTYEQELHVSIETFADTRRPEIIYNVGCAEGYYAVGLARMGHLVVHAHDIDPKALRLAGHNAETNMVTDQISFITERFDTKFFHSEDKSLIVLDAEGDEVRIVGSMADQFVNADLIIECHDFMISDATNFVASKLKDSHHIRVVREGSRDPSGIPIISVLSTFDRYLAVCEFRPSLMHWVVAQSIRR